MLGGWGTLGREGGRPTFQKCSQKRPYPEGTAPRPQPQVCLLVVRTEPNLCRLPAGT